MIRRPRDLVLVAGAYSLFPKSLSKCLPTSEMSVLRSAESVLLKRLLRIREAIRPTKSEVTNRFGPV
jgi:hypothetical protein